MREKYEIRTSSGGRLFCFSFYISVRLLIGSRLCDLLRGGHIDDVIIINIFLLFFKMEKRFEHLDIVLGKRKCRKEYCEQVREAGRRKKNTINDSEKYVYSRSLSQAT